MTVLVGGDRLVVVGMVATHFEVVGCRIGDFVRPLVPRSAGVGERGCAPRAGHALAGERIARRPWFARNYSCLPKVFMSPPCLGGDWFVK